MTATANEVRPTQLVRMRWEASSTAGGAVRSCASTVPTLWIVLGPLGQSITAANLLAGVRVLPGQAAFGVLYGTITWGFALLWVAIAATVTVRTARRGLPFALTWWSFVFPLGTLVTGTSALAKQVPSAMFTGVAVVLYGALVLAWVTVAVRTLFQR